MGLKKRTVGEVIEDVERLSKAMKDAHKHGAGKCMTQAEFKAALEPLMKAYEDADAAYEVFVRNCANPKKEEELGREWRFAKVKVNNEIEKLRRLVKP